MEHTFHIMRFVNVRELHHSTPRVVAKASRGETFVITKNGKPQALLLPLNEREIEDLVLSSPAFLKEIEASRALHKKRGGISLAQARKKLGLVRGAKR
ncbi:MAG: type II toxin-antitoxin system Phd/YefM family antitoxin [Elusimicrobia bacterium]|nr:type II toxin-antitoxin system Phd/YefM family antitoxin [Elusimicrobiota bacterium]